MTATAKAGLKADAELQLQTAIASLEANLPKLLVVIKARGAAFTSSLQAAVDAGGSLAASGKLNAKGTVCGVLIGAAAADASTNFVASLNAAGSVATSLKIN